MRGSCLATSEHGCGSTSRELTNAQDEEKAHDLAKLETHVESVVCCANLERLACLKVFSVKKMEAQKWQSLYVLALLSRREHKSIS